MFRPEPRRCSTSPAPAIRSSPPSRSRWEAEWRSTTRSSSPTRAAGIVVGKVGTAAVSLAELEPGVQLARRGMTEPQEPGLRGRDIVCVGFADWQGGFWTNQQHLMSRLAVDNRVLFVESLGLRQAPGRSRRRSPRRPAGPRRPRGNTDPQRRPRALPTRASVPRKSSGAGAQRPAADPVGEPRGTAHRDEAPDPLGLCSAGRGPGREAGSGADHLPLR